MWVLQRGGSDLCRTRVPPSFLPCSLHYLYYLWLPLNYHHPYPLFVHEECCPQMQQVLTGPGREEMLLSTRQHPWWDLELQNGKVYYGNIEVLCNSLPCDFLNRGYLLRSSEALFLCSHEYLWIAHVFKKDFDFLGRILDWLWWRSNSWQLSSCEGSVQFKVWAECGHLERLLHRAQTHQLSSFLSSRPCPQLVCQDGSDWILDVPRPRLVCIFRIFKEELWLD